MKKFRVAVIGCGAVAKNHGKALSKSSQADLVYAVDCDRSKAEAFARTYGGEVLTDYHQLFEKKDVDAVHIVTPHFTHAEIAIDCMLHGLDVFCEKPLSIAPYDVKRMIAISDQTGKRLGVCFQNRLNQATVEAKKLIDSGEYGRIVSAMVLVAWDRGGEYYSKSDWRGTYEKEGGGCIINQSIHTLDLLDYLCGGVEAVSGFDAKLRNDDGYEVEDSAMFYCTLKNGAVAIGFCSNCYPMSKQCTLEIHLEKALLTVEQSGLTIECDGKKEHHTCEVAQGEKSEWGLSHGRLIEAFYSSLQSGEPFICDAKTGLHAVEIVNAIQHSKGKFIRIGDV